MSRALRINYVAYCDPFEWHGGGEAVTAALIEEGRRLGHEIRRTCVFPRPVDDAHPDPDFWILADVHNIPECWWRRLPEGLLARVVAGAAYVHVDTAYVDVCDLGYLPCNGDVEGDACPFKRRRWLRSRRCFRLSARAMYRGSRLNIFLSPLHRRTVERLIGAEAIGRSFEMRPVIDTERFVNRHGPRDIEALYVGVIHEAKGADALAARFPDGTLTLAGSVADPRYRGIGRQLGRVPYDEMPALFNRARTFVHLPRWPEPQGRAVAEAALCGCALETNDRVGATSFGLDLADPASYEGAAADAWTAMIDAVGPYEDAARS